jgi:hypothetical protein
VPLKTPVDRLPCRNLTPCLAADSPPKFSEIFS